MQKLTTVGAVGEAESTRSTMKIQCENCGRKATVRLDESREPMRYCRRCGEELPPPDERTPV